MSIFLQDSSSVYYLLGITTLGQLTTQIVPGPRTVNSLYLIDPTGTTWQLGVSTSGQLTTTSTSSHTATLITVTDSNGNNWTVSVDPSGQLIASFVVFPGDLTPGTCVAWRVI